MINQSCMRVVALCYDYGLLQRVVEWLDLLIIKTIWSTYFCPYFILLSKYILAKNISFCPVSLSFTLVDQSIEKSLVTIALVGFLWLFFINNFIDLFKFFLENYYVLKLIFFPRIINFKIMGLQLWILFFNWLGLLIIDNIKIWTFRFWVQFWNFIHLS